MAVKRRSILETRRITIRQFRPVTVLVRILLAVCWLLLLILIWNIRQLPHGPGEYFRDTIDATTLVVNSKNCKIPDLVPFDQSLWNVLRLPKPVRNCSKSWAYIKDKELVLTDVPHEVVCCVYSIHRVDQPLHNYNDKADRVVRRSSNCHPIKASQHLQITDEFIMLECSKSKGTFHREYFVVPQFDENASTKQMSAAPVRKRPPNVVIIGIDTNSRMNLHRYMGNTVQALRDVGAVEMKGYAKVGDHTFENTVAFLTGLSVDELRIKCFQRDDVPQDTCPYLWKAFDERGYLTMLAEDRANIAIFNYLRTGFLRKPTHFYMLPFWQGVEKFEGIMNGDSLDCLGSRRPEQVLLDHVLDILNKSAGAPLFAHTWQSWLSHDHYPNAQHGDLIMAQYVRAFAEIKNTVFFFMSDHGQRHGSIRTTLQGWFEDKLVTQWVYIPPNLRRSFPEWMQALKDNSNKLSSPFDLYQTMVHILQTFEDFEPFWKLFSRGLLHYGRGQSLLTPLSKGRGCENAGIPLEFCPCIKPVPLKIGDWRVGKAVAVSIKHLREAIPKDLCEMPTLFKVVTSAVLKDQSREGVETLLVTFYTNPGYFLFEANVDRWVSNGSFVLRGDLFRVNTLARNADCVNTSLLRTYCFCSGQSGWRRWFHL